MKRGINVELTKLEKLFAICGLLHQMQEQEIESDLKPSEGMKVMTEIVKEVEHLPEAEQEELAKQAYVQAVRNLYNSVFNENTQGEAIGND